MLGVAILVVVLKRQRGARGRGSGPRSSHRRCLGGRQIFGGSLDNARSIALSALMSLFGWAAVLVILRDLFHERAVGTENVLGVICGYLIAGEAWAGANEIAYLAIPVAYSINPDISTLLAEWQVAMRCFCTMPSLKCSRSVTRT